MQAFPYVRITDADNINGIDLNDFDGYLMTSPTGFGIYRVAEYITIGNQRVSVDNKPQFYKITFNIDIFGKRPEMEQKYAILRDFIGKNIHKGFRLYYTPLDKTRYINCDILVADKTQKENAYLPIRLEVQPKSLWLDDVKRSSVQQADETGVNLFEFKEREINGVTQYSASFDLVDGLFDEYDKPYYAVSFSSGTINQVLLYNGGQETSPLLIRVYGVAINPIIRLAEYGSNEVKQIIEFDNLTIEQGYYLEINSDPENTYIHLVNAKTGERFDRENYAKLESNIYMTLPTGNWVMTISDESGVNQAYTDVFYSNQYYGG